MSSSTRPPSNPNPNAPAPSTNGGGADHSYFEEMRGELVREIAVALEQVLQNVNRLNRGLEGVIAVGNEFSSVEALWSQFENVMGKDAEGDREGKDGAVEGDAEGGDEAAGGEDEEEADEEGEDDTVVR